MGIRHRGKYFNPYCKHVQKIRRLDYRPLDDSLTRSVAREHLNCVTACELLKSENNNESGCFQVNLPFILTLIGLLTGAGAADHLVAYRHKKKLHDISVRFWIRLYDTPIPDLPKLLAHWVVTRTERILNTKWKAFIGYLIVCTLFLTFVLTISENGYQPKGGALVLPPTVAQKALKPDLFDSSPLPHVGILITVVAFDMITLFLTLSFLRAIRNADWSATVLLFVGHASTLFILTVTCLATVTFVSSELFNQNVIGVRYQKQMATLSRVEVFNYYASHLTNFNSGTRLSTNAVVVSCNIQHSFASDLKSNYQSLFDTLKGNHPSIAVNLKTIFSDNGILTMWTYGYEEYVPASGFLVVGTIALPAILIMVLLGFLVVAKILLSIVKTFSLYFIDLATEKPPEAFKPFFLMACSADVLLLLVKGLKEIISKL